jgi:hypothetical protein
MVTNNCIPYSRCGRVEGAVKCYRRLSKARAVRVSCLHRRKAMLCLSALIRCGCCGSQMRRCQWQSESPLRHSPSHCKEGENIPGHSTNKCHLYNLHLSYTSINYSGHFVLQVAPSTAYLCVRPKCQPLQLRIPRGQLSHRRSLQQPQGALIVLVCWRVCARFGMTWTGGGST